MQDVMTGQLLEFEDLTPGTSYELQLHVAPRPCEVIKIRNNSNRDALSLAQVQAWDYNGTNRASDRNGGVAWQTSTAYSGIASRAIDNNTSGLWGHKSVTHTVPKRRAYWQVVLNPPSFIRRVDVFNRTDCCSDRLDGAELEMIGTDDELLYKTTLNGDAKQTIMVPP